MMNPVEISDLYSYSFCGNLQTKGDTTVFVKGQLDEETNRLKTDLMMYKGKKIRPLTSRGNVSAFAFRTHKSICFFQPEEDGKKSALYLLSLKGGEAQKIESFDLAGCAPIGFIGKNLLVFMAMKDLNKEDPIQGGDVEVLCESPWYFNNEGFISKKRTLLYTFDLETGELGAPIGEDFFVSATALYDHKIYFAASPAQAIRPVCHDEIFEYDPATGLLVSVCKTGLDVYSLDGMNDCLYLFGTDRKAHGMNTNPWLYEISLDTRSMRCVLEWEEAVGNSVGTDCAAVGGNMICKNDGRLFFTGTIVNHNNLFCYDRGTLHQVLEWPGTIHSFGIADGKLYFIGAKPGGMQELFCMEEGEVLQISNFQKQMEGKYVAKARPVFYTGWNGTSQMGWVLYPRDFAADKTYPAILDIHGGPKTVYGTVFYHEMQVWASHGYFVFFCNPFGSDGQGNDYADLRGKYGTQDYDDLMNFTDAVLEAVPQIDPGRLGVTGGSYGGFMTNWIITHTQRFAAAATQRSISNWISFWGTSDIGPDFTEDQQQAALDDPMALWEHSPMKYIKNAKTPTLLIHSDEDYRCPIEQGYQMLNGLLNNGTEARMALFHHENHELSRSGKPANRVRRLEEITNWMDSHLKGAEHEA